MVSSSAPSVFSVQALALLAEVGHHPTCIAQEHIQENYNQHVCSPSDSSPSFGYGVSQWWEGKSCATHLPPHVLCLPLPEKSQVRFNWYSVFYFFCVYIIFKFIMSSTSLPVFSPSVPIICPVSVPELSCWAAWVVMPTLSVPGKRKCWSSSWILCSSLWSCPVSASKP